MLTERPSCSTLLEEAERSRKLQVPPVGVAERRTSLTLGGVDGAVEILDVAEAVAAEREVVGTHTCTALAEVKGLLAWEW